jgi:hypothetical protein
MSNKFYKTDKSIYVESDISLDGFKEVSKREYDLKVKPTQEQKLKAYLFSEDTSSNKKEYLYTFLKYQLDEDFLYNTSKPLFGNGKTVDEIQAEITKYDSDKEDYVILLKAAKKEAKQYIRDLVKTIGDE